MPHRRCRSVEHLSMGAVCARAAEVGVRNVCRAGQPDDGTTVRRPEAQSAPDADRRRRPSSKMVLRAEERVSRHEEEWRGFSASDERAGDVEVEKLVTHKSRNLTKRTLAPHTNQNSHPGARFESIREGPAQRSND